MDGNSASTASRRPDVAARGQHDAQIQGDLARQELVPDRAHGFLDGLKVGRLNVVGDNAAGMFQPLGFDEADQQGVLANHHPRPQDVIADVPQHGSVGLPAQIPGLVCNRQTLQGDFPEIHGSRKFTEHLRLQFLTERALLTESDAGVLFFRQGQRRPYVFHGDLDHVSSEVIRDASRIASLQADGKCEVRSILHNVKNSCRIVR